MLISLRRNRGFLITGMMVSTTGTVALLYRNGGSQNPDRWLKRSRNTQFLEYGNVNIRFKYRVVEGSPSTGVVPSELILDGQQRLTSIYSSLFSPDAVHTRTDKVKDINRYYYIDIEKALNTDTDRVDAIISVPDTRIVTSNFGRDVELDLSTPDKEYEQKR